MNEFLLQFTSIIFGVFGWLGTVLCIVWDAIRPAHHEKCVRGKNVLLIGCGDIGLGLAKEFAARGARISFWDNSQEALETVRKTFPGSGEKIITKCVNISDIEQVRAAASELIDVHRFEVDFLVNAAGIGNRVDCFEESMERTNLILDVNVKGVVYVIRTFLPRFLERRSGHLVTLASLAGQIGCAHICEYSATKFAVVGYMDSVEIDLLSRGIHELEFTTICPSFVETKMAAAAKLTGTTKFPVVKLDEAVGEMIRGILVNQRHVIIPWECRLLVAFKRLLPVRQMNLLLSRQWTY